MHRAQQCEQQRSTVTAPGGGLDRDQYDEQGENDDRSQPQHPVGDPVLIAQQHEAGDDSGEYREQVIGIESADQIARVVPHDQHRHQRERRDPQGQHYPLGVNTPYRKVGSTEGRT